jgi:hypothetical protein
LDDFDWHGGAITRATPVIPSYRSKQNVRRFLHAECGAGFKVRPAIHAVDQGRHAKTMGAVAKRMAPAPGQHAVMDDTSTLPMPIGAEMPPPES